MKMRNVVMETNYILFFQLTFILLLLFFYYYYCLFIFLTSGQHAFLIVWGKTALTFCSR